MNRAGVGRIHARFFRGDGGSVSVFFSSLAAVPCGRFRDIVSAGNNLSFTEAGGGVMRERIGSGFLAGSGKGVGRPISSPRERPKGPSTAAAVSTRFRFSFFAFFELAFFELNG